MRNIVLKIILTAVLFFSSLIGMAQPGGMPKDPIPVRDPYDAPIDNAILFLLIAAVGLGLYMVARNYKKKALKS